MLRSVAKQHKKLITFNHNPKGDLHNGIRQRTDRLTQEMIEQLKADLKTAKTYHDLMDENGVIKKIIKASLEGMLDAGLTNILVMKNTPQLEKTPAIAEMAKPMRHSRMITVR